MKWEYKIVRVRGGEYGNETLYDRLQFNLDMYGNEGWEAVASLNDEGVAILMKRQISN